MWLPRALHAVPVVELLIIIIRLLYFAYKAPSAVKLVDFRASLSGIASLMDVTLSLIILSARLLIILPTILALVVNRWIVSL